MQNLHKGLYISRTLEQVLQDEDGRQLAPEALHVLGSCLLLLNERFPCLARQVTCLCCVRIDKLYKVKVSAGVLLRLESKTLRCNTAVRIEYGSFLKLELTRYFGIFVLRQSWL
jgi:hypothetical protein